MPIAEQRLREVNLTPQARPVDTFVQAAAPKEGPGIQLARALQDIQPGVRAYLEQKQKDADAADSAKARKAALTDAKSEIADIESGKLYPQESKVFQKVYKDQKGQMLAQQWRAEAETAYNEQGLQNSTDPKDFDGFLQGFLKDRLDGVKDPHILTGALGVVEQTVNNFSLQNSAVVAKNLQNQYLDDSMGLMSQVIDNEMAGSLRESRDFSLDAVMKGINASNARALFLKLPGQEFRKRLTDMVIDKATRNADPHVLDILDQKFDNGVPLADGYWKTKKDEALKAVDSRQMQIEQYTYERDERTRKAQLQKGQSAVLTLLAQNPYVQLTAAQLADFEKYAPGLGEDAITIKNKLIESREKVSPTAALSSIAAFAQRPGDFSLLMKAVMSGNADASLLRWGLTAYEKANQLGNGDSAEGWRIVRGHPAVSPFVRRFENAAQDPFLKGLQERAPNEIAAGEAQFNVEMLEYMQTHQSASNADIRAYAAKSFNEITDDVKKRLGADDSVPDTATTMPSAVAPVKKPVVDEAPPKKSNIFDTFDHTEQ